MHKLSEIEIKLQKGRVGSADAGKRFAILRTAKIKSIGNMGASLSHTFRERHTPNADLERTPTNTVLIGSDNAQDVLDEWTAKAPVQRRKNAVLAVEYLVTGSPAAMKAMSLDEQDRYFDDALSWLKERHGEENIISAVIHRDETTPHLTAMVLPIVDGKLNAKHFLGGREKLSQMQTDFAETVAADHGLERGLENSKAKHQRVSRHYTTIQMAPRDAVSLPERQKGAILGVGAENDRDWLLRAGKSASEQVWEHRMAREAAEKRAADIEQTAQEALKLAKHETELADTAYDQLEKVQAANKALRGGLKSAEQISAERQEELKAKEARIERLEMAIREAGVVDDVNAVFQEQQRAAQEREHARQLELEKQRQHELEAKQQKRHGRSLDDDSGWGL